MKSLIAFVLVLAMAGQSLWAVDPVEKRLQKIRNKVSQCMDEGNHASVETLVIANFPESSRRQA